MKIAKKIISLGFLVFWMCLIFSLSHQSGNVSSSESSGIISYIFTLLFNLFNLDISMVNHYVEIFHEPIRELMHLLEYLVLGILLINVLYQFNFNKNIFVIAIIFCCIFSITDEVHQLFIKGRAFQFLDIIMDNIGSLIGIFVFKKIKKL